LLGEFLEEPVGYRYWKQTKWLARAVKAVTVTVTALSLGELLLGALLIF
jgi:hypothetical protein